MFRRIVNLSRIPDPARQNEITEQNRKILIGYARATPVDGDLDEQRITLKAAGCTEVITDEVKAASSDRPGLLRAIEQLTTDHVLVVCRLDRLGRSTMHLVSLIEEIHRRGADFRTLEEQIDTSAPGGKHYFNMAAALVAFERSMTGLRTKEGMAAVRASGVKVGRKPKLTRQQAADAQILIDAGRLRQDVAKTFGVSMPTLRRTLQAYGLAETDQLERTASSPSARTDDATKALPAD